MAAAEVVVEAAEAKEVKPLVLLLSQHRVKTVEQQLPILAEAVAEQAQLAIMGEIMILEVRVGQE